MTFSYSYWSLLNRLFVEENFVLLSVLDLCCAYHFNNYNELFLARVSLGRILTGCYWFCILVWVSTYTANLAAFFTVTNTDLPINNLEDIVKSSYHVAVVDSSSTYEAFKTSQYEPHRKIWNRMSEEKTIIQDTPAGIQLVRDRDEFAFIGDGPILRLAAIQPPCGLTTGKIHTHPLITLQCSVVSITMCTTLLCFISILDFPCIRQTEYSTFINISIVFFFGRSCEQRTK